MTIVLYGRCPDCDRDFSAFGALHYSDTGERVVACTCGSRRPLMEPPYPFDYGVRAKNEAARKVRT